LFPKVARHEIVPGIAQIGLGYVNAFSVAASEPILVDCGTPKAGPRIRKAMQEAGASTPVRHILVTHHHVDHVGPLAELGGDAVTVWAHGLDARVIRGDVAAPRPASRSALDRAGVELIERLGPKASPARVDREISDGEQISIGDGFIAYHTPGHTAGHVSFLYPSKRVLFVGDAAANMFGKLGPPFGLYSEDHGAVRESIAKIAALDFDIACFGHGRVLKGNACAKFRALAEKIAG
jgi:glyoxylase-like metal-dependent hydrolase (beta-lactamase superfamily II)